MNVKPVMLPPGRAKLATKPCPTGSLTTEKTIGMVRVACFSAAMTGVRAASGDNVGCEPTSSFTRAWICAISPPENRCSIVMLLLLYPAERLSSSRKAATRAECLLIVLGEPMQERDAPLALTLLRTRGDRPRSRPTQRTEKFPPPHNRAPCSGEGILAVQDGPGRSKEQAAAKPSYLGDGSFRVDLKRPM